MPAPITLLRLPFLHRLMGRPPIIGVLPLYGPVGSTAPLRFGLSLASLNEHIERVFRLPGLTAVALLINSPGGSAVQSSLITDRIRTLAEKKDVPVYAFCEDYVASGGYWLACAANDIHVNESSVVGSIGAIAGTFGFPELMRRLGIERRVYTACEKKALLDPFRELPEEGEAKLREFLGAVHQTFIEIVRERRGARLKAEDDVLFSGEFWDGKRAVELGLVDGIGELNATMRKIYGEKAVLHRMRMRRPSLLRRRLGAEDYGFAHSVE